MLFWVKPELLSMDFNRPRTAWQDSGGQEHLEITGTSCTDDACVPLQLLNPTTLRRSSCQKAKLQEKVILFYLFFKYPVRFTWSNVSPWSLWHEQRTFCSWNTGWHVWKRPHRWIRWQTYEIPSELQQQFTMPVPNGDGAFLRQTRTVLPETDAVYGLRRQRWWVVDSRMFFWMLQRLDRDII